MPVTALVRLLDIQHNQQQQYKLQIINKQSRIHLFFFIFRLAQIILPTCNQLEYPLMNRNYQTPSKGQIQISYQSSSSSSLSSLSQSSQFWKNNVPKKMGNHGINQSFEVIQKSKHQNRQLETSTDKIRHQFVSMLAKRKDQLKMLDEDIQRPKHDLLINLQRQPIKAKRGNQVVHNDAEQELPLLQQQRLYAEQRQNFQILKVHLQQPSVPQPFPELQFQQIQKPKLQQCFEQQNSSFEFISKETFNKTFSSLTIKKQQAYLKLKIIQPYLRATIQVLSGKFRTQRSVELEYLWDFDHYRVWLTRQQAKQQAFLLYMQKCRKDTEGFLLSNGIQAKCKRASSLLFKGIKKVFLKIVLQKIRIFEAIRKDVIEDIKACKAHKFSETISTPPKNFQKKKMMKLRGQEQPLSALEETLKLTEKYLNKNKLGGTVVNIIAPNLNIFDKTAERKFKKDQLDGLSITQIFEYRRELQSLIQKHRQVKEENPEVELNQDQIE